jgi:DNA-binding beta-propeller fold protein YncE
MTVGGGGRLLVGDYGRDDTDGRGSVVDLHPFTGRPSGRPIATTDPFEIAADTKTMWVTDTEELQVVDLRTRRVTATIRPDGDALDVALLDDRAWVVDNDSSRLAVYDARTGARRGRSIGIARPFSIAAAGRYVWVTTEQGELVRVPVDGGRPASVVVGGEGPRLVEADAHGVWVVDDRGGVVLVDPQKLTVVGRLRLDGKLEDVTLEGGGAWILRSRSSAPSTVVRVVRAPPR